MGAHLRKQVPLPGNEQATRDLGEPLIEEILAEIDKERSRL